MIVSIAEEMGVREMGDLAQSLEKLNIPYNYIVLNRIRPASHCKFCLTKRESQEKYIAKVKKEYPKKRSGLSSSVFLRYKRCRTLKRII